jgi:hypothetical protein
VGTALRAFAYPTLGLSSVYVMPKIRFDGHVFPRVIQVSVKDNPTINWFDDERKQNISLKIVIQNSSVSVECEVEKYEEAVDVARLYLRALDLARATVDLFAFSSGRGLTVLFETITQPSGVTIPLCPTEPSVAALCKSFQMNPPPGSPNEFDRILRIVSTDWRIAHALRWLIEAITLPHESTANCARAIEGLRNIIATPGIPRGQAWGELRRTLNISELYLKMITDISTGARHADYVHVPGVTVTEVTRRSWIIMDRFLEFKKRNSGPLPLADFPLLAA